MARTAQSGIGIAGQTISRTQVARSLAVEVMLPNPNTELWVDDHVLDQRIDGLLNQARPTVIGTGLGHPDRGQFRACVAPQRLLRRIVLIALYDLM